MACGLPALVSDIPGNLEWVTPGLNGFIFRVGSHRALADRMIEATMDINILRSLGAQSRKVAEQRANWKLNSEKLLLAYELAHSVSSEVSSG
jgi:glycosyltransferase involved in cell wall biosynthesis